MALTLISLRKVKCIEAMARNPNPIHLKLLSLKDLTIYYHMTLLFTLVTHRLVLVVNLMMSQSQTSKTLDSKRRVGACTFNMVHPVVPKTLSLVILARSTLITILAWAIGGLVMLVVE